MNIEHSIPSVAAIEQQNARTTTFEKTENKHHSDGESIASDELEEMEPFDTYQTKIEQLLHNIGFEEFLIEALQHGYNFNNCVYALTSSSNPEERYILRVPIDGAIRDLDGRHERLESEIAVLDFLKDRLPVPRVKAYSLTTDNVLEAAYTLQTRILGESLNKLWGTMDLPDKYAIVDEFLKLLVELESVRFSRAGTFAATATLPSTTNDFIGTDAPRIDAYEPYIKDDIAQERNFQLSGSETKSFLKQHLKGWIQEEVDRDQHNLSCSIGPRFQRLIDILIDMEGEGAFRDTTFPIVLHHCDLEPRNIMVSNASGAWKICGIIDWDGAVSLPTPLSRVPPRWIWHFPDEDAGFEDGFLNDDQYADPELSEENKALKAHFDTKIEVLLPGYTEDAHGRGRWMRRIWHFAEDGAFRVWQWEFLDQLPKDWAARPKPKDRGRVLEWIKVIMRTAQSTICGGVFSLFRNECR